MRGQLINRGKDAFTARGLVLGNNVETVHMQPLSLTVVAPWPVDAGKCPPLLGDPLAGGELHERGRLRRERSLLVLAVQDWGIAQ